MCLQQPKMCRHTRLRFLVAEERIEECTICLASAYEPVTLACGHSYCGGCIVAWRAAHGAASCPDCVQ